MIKLSLAKCYNEGLRTSNYFVVSRAETNIQIFVRFDE